MVKPVPSKISVKEKKKQGLEIGPEAVRALRTLEDKEAFYFYEAVGKPTGELARNLSDFLDKIKVIKSESLLFHLQRGDFQKWIENTLGDSKLGKQLAKISATDYGTARTNVCHTVEGRIEELRESCLTVSIQDQRSIVAIRV